MLRAGAFLVLVAGADLWLLRHLGLGVDHLLAFGGGAAAVTGALGYLDKLLDEHERAAVHATWHRLATPLRALISTPFLAVAWLLALFFGSSYAAVRILPATGSGSESYTLERLSGAGGRIYRGRLERGVEAVRVLARTSPFGSEYRLAVEGYEPEIVHVAPWTGSVVSLETDLRRVPSILVRIPYIVLKTVGNGARFRAWRGDSLIASVTSRAGAYLLGPRRPITPERVEIWRDELRAKDVTDGKPLSQAVLAWWNPVEVALDAPLRLGDSLRIEVCGRSGSVLADGGIAVRSGELLELPLNYVSEERSCEP